MQHGTAAHGARLQRHVQGAAVEPVVAQPLRGSAQGKHLRMGGGVLARQRGVAARPHHLAIFDHHRAHGHLAGSRRLPRQAQGVAHPVGVIEGSARVGMHSRALSSGTGLLISPRT